MRTSLVISSLMMSSSIVNLLWAMQDNGHAIESITGVYNGKTKKVKGKRKEDDVVQHKGTITFSFFIKEKNRPEKPLLSFKSECNKNRVFMHEIHEAGVRFDNITSYRRYVSFKVKVKAEFAEVLNRLLEGGSKIVSISSGTYEYLSDLPVIVVVQNVKDTISGSRAKETCITHV